MACPETQLIRWPSRYTRHPYLDLPLNNIRELNQDLPAPQGYRVEYRVRKLWDMETLAYLQMGSYHRILTVDINCCTNLGSSFSCYKYEGGGGYWMIMNCMYSILYKLIALGYSECLLVFSPPPFFRA